MLDNEESRGCRRMLSTHTVHLGYLALQTEERKTTEFKKKRKKENTLILENDITFFFPSLAHIFHP